MSDVLIYNLGGVEILGRVSVNHAIKMVVGGKAKIIEEFEGKLFGPYPLPKAVELLKFVFAKWKFSKEVQCTKHNIHRRDHWKCGYCGVKLARDEATIDHIHPQSKGGQLTWKNAVTSCFACNQRKRNRTHEQAGMTLRIKPFKPKLGDLAV